MKAEIKYFYSPDISNLEQFVPEIPDEFCFLLQLMIGERDKKGEESFDITVCTPQWLLKNSKKDSIIYGRHYLIVFEYNFQKIVEELTLLVNSVEGENWSEIGESLSRIGKWEFEDYTE